MNEKNEKHLDNLIQKSRPLLNLWRSDFEIYEFKLLDLYLSKINSDNPKKRTVVIEKGKVEEIFGVSRLRKESLLKNNKHRERTAGLLFRPRCSYHRPMRFGTHHSHHKTTSYCCIPMVRAGRVALPQVAFALI